MATSARLSDLPEELLLGLSSYLCGQDLLRLSFFNSRLMSVFQSSHLWLNLMRRDELKQDRHIFKFSITQRSHCPEKLSYILHSRLKRGWLNSKFKISSLPLHDNSKVGYDNRHLVILTKLSNLPRKTWNVKVWDISSQGHQQLFVLFNWSTKLLDSEFDLDLTSILVANSTAVLCFSGKGNDTPTILMASDLKNDFQELWRHEMHDWGQFEVPRLLGGSIYKFNLLANKIEVFNVRNFHKTYTLTLVEEMRYPREGGISGDGNHLVIPGKLAINNMPAVSVWTLRDASQRFLLPNQAVCPYRWFEKTDVRNGFVYGLLNRRCLIIWDAETSKCLQNLELTDSAPGDNEPALSFTFLTVSDTLVATINILPGKASIFDSKGNAVTVLQPGKKQEMARYKVCDIHITEYCILVRMVNFSQPDFKVISYPLSSLSQPVKDELPSSQIELVPVNECVLHEFGVTKTKLLNFAKNEIRIYDFL